LGKIFKALEKSDKEAVNFEVRESGRNKEPETAGFKTSADDAALLNNHVKTDLHGGHGNNGNENEKADCGCAGPNLITSLKPYSIEAEQFRVLKNSLLFSENDRPCRTIMVTSTVQEEGKSFVAANLAVAMASSIDQYVLLMDCDLRKPTLHNMFGLENRQGLSTYLIHGVPLSSVLSRTFMPKLTLLPAGEPPANPSELVSSEQMRRLINEVENRYDDRYIIIDAPPPYMTSEANALAKHVDAILLIVKQGTARKDRIQDIVDIYGKDKIIGVVKNFAKGKFGLDYGYRYKYGYGYGTTEKSGT